VPTLVLWGEDDVLFPKEYAAAWARLIAGAEAVVIPRCGHVPNVEKPVEFAAALTAFIARHGASDR
jgi:pimeloyl-ACP methyl ester carboxylesterase